MDLQQTFRSVVQALAAAAVPHAFIGALPVLAWGRVRATTDIDVVVIVNDWERLLDTLEKHGLKQGSPVGPADSADSLPDIAVFYTRGDRPVRVDIFITKTDFEREVIATAREADALGMRVRLASPEASIIYKLIAQRRRDLDDVDGIFAARSAAGETLDWDFLDRWATAWGIEDRLGPYKILHGPAS